MKDDPDPATSRLVEMKRRAASRPRAHAVGPSPRMVVRNLQRRYKVDTRALRGFLIRVAEELDSGAAALTLILVSDLRIRDLNREFRGFDKPTDVLSFPAGEPIMPEGAMASAESVLPIESQSSYLGDIAISVETAHRQARRRNSHLRRELKVLTLHGLLHLLGYDHETDDGEMRRIEYRLRRRYRITTPRKRTS